MKSGRKYIFKINDTFNLNLIISQAYFFRMRKRQEKKEKKPNTREREREKSEHATKLLPPHFMDAFQHKNLSQIAANSPHGETRAATARR